MINASHKQKILLIYTGGTIGMVKDYTNESLKPFDFENIINHIPEIALINAEINFLSFENPIDSSEITPQHWQELTKIIEKNYHIYDGFVVLHGTDTMAFTASAVSFILCGLQKPIVFTGSQLPIGDLRTDAKENLISSIHYAALNENGNPTIKEVCLYFEYKLYRANRATKVNADNFDAFRSPNFPLLGEAGVHLHVNQEYLWKSPNPTLEIQNQFSDAIGLLKIFPGMNISYLLSLVNVPEIKVLIIEAYGAGNIFQEHKFISSLKTRVENGMHLIVTTQCAGGSVELGKYNTSRVFLELGAISGKDHTTEAAVTKAMWLMGNYNTEQSFKQLFESNLRGECH